MRRVTKICHPAMPKPRRRVAAYARVSMATDRLENSLSNQISAYSSLIQANPEWEYAGVFVDDGISGTSVSNRAGFQQMLAECEKGRVDLVLTKSISRFARNTVDLLNTVRHLKDIGVEVRFEKERISTFSGDGELMLTILASFAQEESRSLSENVKWAKRKSFEQGAVGRRRVYGYRWKGDTREIYEPEAAIIRRIFQEYIDGAGYKSIVDGLKADGIKKPSGKDFCNHTVRYILTNRLYIGEDVLQKTYIEDPINKRKIENKGELPKYVVTGTCEPIITREMFEKAQAEPLQRQKTRWLGRRKGKMVFRHRLRLKCGRCGRFLRRYTDSHYERAYWGCPQAKEKCSMKWVPESEVERCCAEAMGCGDFDLGKFDMMVKEIIVLEENRLFIRMKDGHGIEKRWKGRSNADWWTPEIREAKGKLQHYRASTDPAFSCFSTRLICPECGTTLIKNECRWICRNKHVLIRDDDLRRTVRVAMGKISDKRFKEIVRCVDVFVDEIVLHKMDGEIIHQPRKVEPRGKFIFSHRVKCSKCGGNYKHRVEKNGEKLWVCANGCRSYRIPDKNLMMAALLAVGSDFDSVECIDVEDGVLNFVMVDGRSISQICGMRPPRQEFAFTSKIHCVNCGGTLIHKKGADGKVRWVCMNRCGAPSMLEKEIAESVSRAIGDIGLLSKAYAFAGRLRVRTTDGREMDVPCKPCSPGKWTEEAMAEFNERGESKWQGR